MLQLPLQSAGHQGIPLYAAEACQLCTCSQIAHAWDESSSRAQGRGTVVTGRVEQGIVRTGDEIEILGINAPIKSIVTGVEMFKKQLNEGQAGDNVGLLLRGIKRDDVVRGQVCPH